MIMNIIKKNIDVQLIDICIYYLVFPLMSSIYLRFVSNLVKIHRNIKKYLNPVFE